MALPMATKDVILRRVFCARFLLRPVLAPQHRAAVLGLAG